MQKVIPWVCIFYLVVVAIYYGFLRGPFISEELQNYFNSKNTISAVVVANPDIGLDKTQIVVQPIGLREKILIKLGPDIDVEYGDHISFTAQLRVPESFSTDTGRSFNYPAFLAVRNIYATVTVYEFSTVGHNQEGLLLKTLFSLKRYFVSKIRELLPESEAGLFAGIIIGEKSLLPKDVLTDFQVAGLTHMIVLSGYNITIVSIAVMGILAMAGLGYRTRRLGGIITIPLFIVMTGMGASSVRAGIMAVIVFLLQIMTRPAHSFRVILFTLTIMVVTNPASLLYDPSLHLSFLAFIGLIYVAPITEKYFSSFSDWWGLRDLISETLAVQLFVLPYIIYMSGQVSLLTLVANILTVPMVPMMMGFGFGVVLLDMISQMLGSIFIYPIKLGLSYIISVTHIVAGISSMVITISPVSIWFLVVTYSFLVGFCAWYHK